MSTLLLIQALEHQAASGGVAVSVISLSSLALLLAGGIAWGKMDHRVKTLEDSDFICREEFNLIKERIDEIREDVREIRRRGP